MGKLRDQLAAAQVAREQFHHRQAEIEHRASRADREHSLTLVLSGLAAFYLAVRFGATKQLDALNAYASYFFEISLVVIATLLLRPRLSWKALLKPLTIAIAVAALASGFAILKIARIANINVPMDVHSGETVFFLLAVAPVLEELIFRFMLFKPLERIFNSRNAWLVTSVLFSYSHLHTIWSVPQDYHQFLLFQAAYTFPLALACGFMVRRQRSLLSAILVHAAFNLGFFLAFWA